MSEANITVAVDLTNPGQFFACCGLLELADRLWPGAEGWFDDGIFAVQADGGSLLTAIDLIRNCTISNTMTPEQRVRLEDLSAMSKNERASAPTLEGQRKLLESLRRELPIVISGGVRLVIDWFTDDSSGGSRFKTWAGQQSVIDIATAMHRGLTELAAAELWASTRGAGLPFNFDSDLGGQGSALDVGFSFDPLAANEGTRIGGTCKPALEFLCFVGLQRFRPREIPTENRFVYAPWRTPLPPSAASGVACGAVGIGSPQFEFKLLYRTKYLKSFMPAMPFRGDADD